MSITLKPQFLKVALIAVMIAGMPVSHAKSPAQADKVLRVAFPAPDDGFDMVKTSNFYSGNIADVIFERLLQYDYLANPVRLVPATAQSLPVIEKNGQVYTFKIKPGIYFTDDPAFKGKRRELVAEDYVYAVKRILDPKNHAPSFSFIDNKLLGANALVEQANKTGRFDYDAKIEGVKALDKYTIQFKLTQPDYNFPYILAYSTFGATAREVVEYYKDRIGMHPVGTGPYMLSRYVPRSKIELIANPDYRGFTWNFKSTGTAWDNQLVKQMSGKHMPQIGKVTVSIIEEEQSRWLAFQSRQLDFDSLTANAIAKALDQNNQLNAEMQKKGIRLYANKEAEVTYTMFNMRDPVVGGSSLDKIALRRAIAMSLNMNEYIRILRKGRRLRQKCWYLLV
jgi:ABC-type transport system substrate-binding protein